ncbi:MAG: 5'/3'-nucleotidase SurE [Myxococcaceae bacterium]
MAPRILVSNDDGIASLGLVALAEAMAPLGEVWVVAPDREQSAASHALSLHRPLRIKKVKERWFSVDGTPSDCSYLAINHLLKDCRPTLMVSGINTGPNLADDVTYSGTVAAAMEASILGVPAIAFSLASRQSLDFAGAARFAHALAKATLAAPVAGRLLLNVNVPAGVEPQGYEVTRLGKHSWGVDVIENVDPRGRKYYWIGGTDYQHQDIPGSDCNAVHLSKVVSVTPLHLDLTDDGAIGPLRALSLDGFLRVDAPPR